MCAGPEYPRFAGKAEVTASREIAPGVYSLTVSRSAGEREVPAPVSGQFFMLRARPSGVLLGRPISVYRSSGSGIEFLILKKGRGTEELCALRSGDSLDLVGPVGNRFLPPDEAFSSAGIPKPAAPRIAVIGGGIGVAPVAGFALSETGELPARSFDFYASFRSSPYGLEGIAERAKNLIITTEDGSSGTKGMLPSVFNPADYDLAYACGPTPMLRWIKDACEKVGEAGKGAPLAFLSLEERMACGAGACLGCTVSTIRGNKRCCVDGPVFDSREVIF